MMRYFHFYDKTKTQDIHKHKMNNLKCAQNFNMEKDDLF